MSSMLANDALHVFNKRDRVVESWYWALPSHKLRKGQVKAVNVNGKELAILRTKAGEVVALDAHCAPRGAHFALGRVEGDGIRCHYHRWKYNFDGELTDVPCLDKPPGAHVQRYPTEEKYGLIWVFTGTETDREQAITQQAAEGLVGQ